jgi:hypothetical protein
VHPTIPPVSAVGWRGYGDIQEQVWWKQSWEYKGADGVLKGTFSLAQLSDWLKSGHLYRELMVCYFPCFPLQISFWSSTLACVQ